MSRGFELIRTRPPGDIPDFEYLEKTYNITIPPLYKIFLTYFELGEKKMLTDELVHPQTGHLWPCTWIYSELSDKFDFMFVDFTTIEYALPLMKEQYDADDELFTKKYIMIGGTSSGSTIVLGTEGEDTDMVLLDTESKGRFKKLHVNILQFVQSLVRLPTKPEYLPEGVKFDQLYKNWGEAHWRVKE